MKKQYIVPIMGVLFIGLVLLIKNTGTDLGASEAHQDILELHDNNQHMMQLADSVAYLNQNKLDKISKLDSLNELKDLTIEDQNNQLKKMLFNAEKARGDAEKARDEAIESKKLAEKYKALSLEAEKIAQEQKQKAEQAYHELQIENKKLREKIDQLKSNSFPPDTTRVYNSVIENPIEETNSKKKKNRN